MTAGADELRGAVERIAPAAAVERLLMFLSFLRAENDRMNLVSAKSAEPAELVARHLRDALDGLPLLPEPVAGRRLRLLDIGSGGGFPAIPLLVCRGDVEGLLYESTGKKAGYLERCLRELGLTGGVVNARFPAALPMNHPFDVLTSRAVAEGGKLVRKARRYMSADARALLWTTDDLVETVEKESGMHRWSFRKSQGAEHRGIAVLERFT